jgi:predicted ABC-type ATPase
MKQIFIFAGPNGSGKSTIVDLFVDSGRCAKNFICPDNFIVLEDKEHDETAAYIAAMQKAEAARYQQIALSESFSFETVLSTASKLDFICYAKRQGYKIHVVYITTSSPEINIARVKDRVKHGGHDVPRDKIISRYEKSMQLMYDVVSEADTAEFYDNSGTYPVFVAEKIENKNLRVAKNPPEWFRKYIISKAPTL